MKNESKYKKEGRKAYLKRIKIDDNPYYQCVRTEVDRAGEWFDGWCREEEHEMKILDKRDNP